MFSIESIKKMNSKAATFKHRQRAKGLNNPGGHAKSAEKGQVLVDQLNRQAVAKRGKNALLINKLVPNPKPYSPEELMGSSLDDSPKPFIKSIPDDPECDGTDFAHPAWWRGNDCGSELTAHRLEESVDGDDSGHGVISSPVIERVRRKILALRSELDRLRKRK